jgi:predicted nucleic acid-binding protein
MNAGTSFTALYDASVLYPAAVRNLLMRLALSGLFRARWSERIHDEWTRAVLRDRPDLTREKLARTRALMDAHASDALVEGFEALIDTLALPDSDDRHVLAAAIHGRADVIVTANLRDFPAEALRPFGIAARHPDEFVLHLLDLAPAAVARAAREHRESLRSPPKNVEIYLETLTRHGLTGTVAALRHYTDLL